MRMNVGAPFAFLFGNPGAGSFQLNASANWLAIGFIPLTGGTLSKVRIYVLTKTGTLGANDLTCDIYSDSNANPGTSLESGNTITSAAASTTWLEFTGFTTSLTSGTRYWLVFKNVTGTPASNNVTYGNLSAFSPSFIPQGDSTDPGGGWPCWWTSTNSGSTWTRSVTNLPQLVIEYSGGAKEGNPLTTIGSSTVQVYSSREIGLMFTTPANGRMNVAGILATCSKSGTPTGSIRMRVYSGAGSSPSLIATTGTLGASSISTSMRVRALFFSSPIIVEPSTVYRIVLSETSQSDTSSNRYNGIDLTITSSDAATLVPFGDAAVTTSTNGGATFSETANRFVPFYFLLDYDSPFASSGGGGSGMIVHPGMAGGMRA